MSESDSSTAPSQQEINAALGLYVDGGKRDDQGQMHTGLSVLRHATEAQIHLAVPVVEASCNLAEGEIETTLKSYGDAHSPETNVSSDVLPMPIAAEKSAGGVPVAPAT